MPHQAANLVIAFPLGMCIAQALCANTRRGLKIGVAGIVFFIALGFMPIFY